MALSEEWFAFLLLLHVCFRSANLNSSACQALNKVLFLICRGSVYAVDVLTSPSFLMLGRMLKQIILTAEQPHVGE